MSSDPEGSPFEPPIAIMNGPAYATNLADDANREPDHCRICRSEGTPHEPLYHPCKCSGSIKFVHQDCLMEWLAHSQKKYCELCKTPFTFTKVYDPDMPLALPTPLFVRQLTRRLGRTALKLLRAILVVLVWLGCLPLCVRWMWRMWFWVSDGGWWQLQVGSLPRAGAPSATSESPLPPGGTSPANGRGIIAFLSSPALSTMMSPLNSGANTTADSAAVAPDTISADFLHPDGIFFDRNPFFNATRFQFVNRLIVDVLEGQLLTALIVVTFIIVFLIREWVVQQQPGIIGDAVNIPLLNEQAAEQDMAPAAQALAAAAVEQDANPREGGGNDGDGDAWVDRAFGLERDDGRGEEVDGAHDEVAAPEPPPQARLIAQPRRRRRVPTAELGPESGVAQDAAEATEATEAAEAVFALGTRNETAPAGFGTVFDFGELPQRPTPTRESTARVANLRRELEETTRNANTNTVYNFGGMSGGTENLYQFGGNPEPRRPSTPWNREDPSADEITERLEIIDTGRTSEWMRENTASAPNSPVSSERRSSEIGFGLGSPDKSGTGSWGSTGSFEFVGGPKDKGKSQEYIVLHNAGEGSTRKGKEIEIPQMGAQEDNEGDLTEENADDDEPRTEGSLGFGASEWSTTAQAGDISILYDSPSPLPAQPPTPPPGLAHLDPLNVYHRRPGADLPRENAQRLNDARRLEEIRARHLPEIRRAVMDDERREEPIDARLVPEMGRLMDEVQRHEEDIQARHVLNARRMVERPEAAFEQPEQPQAQVQNAVVGPVQQPVLPERRGGILDWFNNDDDADAPDQAQDGDDDTDDEDAPADAAALPPVLDDDAADDFEGIMELVGMRGPLVGLVQNAAISSMLITATVAVGVAFPYVTGKTVMMIIAHPVLFFFKLPTMAVSFCAELLVDFATMVGFSLLLMCDRAIKFFIKPVSYIIPGISSYANSSAVSNFLQNWATDGQNRVVAKFTSIETTYLTIRKFPRSAIPPLSLVMKDSIDRLFDSIASGLEKIGLAGFAVSEISIGPDQLNVKGLTVTNPVAWVYHAWEDTFAAVNFTRPINTTADDAFSTANGQAVYGGIYKWSAWDRIGVCLLGYAFFTVAGMIYVKRRRGQHASQVERLVAEFLQQCGGVMKVVLIIGIEMFVFPLYCGMLLDVAMLPLFETATLVSRIQFAIDFPLTNVFVHWFVGTCYMFHFALFVSMCRKIMRTGVLYFIRDPDDPTFHPVRDVLNRPVVTQLRKIGFSAFIYGILVLVCLGGVVWGLESITHDVLPIHWSSNEPVFEFPVDLLFYNFLMPLAVKFFKPSDLLQNMYAWWFRKCARVLRLTSFMFGERLHDEEGYTRYPTWSSFLAREKPDYEHPVKSEVQAPAYKDQVYFCRNGRFVRAPASDSVHRPKGDPIFIPVDEENRRQDIDSSRDLPNDPTGANSPDWRFTYIPPYFRVRIGLVVLGIWVFAAVTGVAVTIGPLLAGRMILRRLVPTQVRLNDIYAFSVGVYAVGSAALCLSKVPAAFGLLRALLRPLTAAASNATNPGNMANACNAIKQLALRSVKIGYVATAFAVVIPTLVALIIEFYFIIPLHTAFGAAVSPTPTDAGGVAGNSTELPQQLQQTPPLHSQIGHTIHFVQDWTLGVLYVKMMGKMLLLDDNSLWARSLRGVVAHGWLNPDAKLATRVFIVPCVGGMVAALTLPLVLARLAVAIGVQDGVLVYRFAFPATLLGVGVAAGMWAVMKVVEGWKEGVRDEVYLRGMRIHNHGEEVRRR